MRIVDAWIWKVSFGIHRKFIEFKRPLVPARGVNNIYIPRILESEFLAPSEWGGERGQYDFVPMQSFPVKTVLISTSTREWKTAREKRFRATDKERDREQPEKGITKNFSSSCTGNNLLVHLYSCTSISLLYSFNESTSNSGDKNVNSVSNPIFSTFYVFNQPIRK